MAGLGVAWVGYGNPFREIPYYNFHDVRFHPNSFDPDYFDGVFFLEDCDQLESCSVKSEHQQVMQFAFSGYGINAPITGQGNNPVAVLERLGFSVLPRPDYAEAALKWCTTDHIIQRHANHFSLYVIPLTENPIATAACVKKQITGPFSVCIANPLGGNRDCDRFAPLEDRNN